MPRKLQLPKYVGMTTDLESSMKIHFIKKVNLREWTVLNYGKPLKGSRKAQEFLNNLKGEKGVIEGDDDQEWFVYSFYYDSSL